MKVGATLAVLVLLGFFLLGVYGFTETVKQARRRRYSTAVVLGILSTTLVGSTGTTLVVAALWLA